MWGDTSTIVVKKLKDVWDEWCDFSCDVVANSGKIFVVYGFDDLWKSQRKIFSVVGSCLTIAKKEEGDQLAP